jgi:hypothetical protein
LVLEPRFDVEIAINQGGLPDGKVKFENADDGVMQPYVELTYELSDLALLAWCIASRPT